MHSLSSPNGRVPSAAFARPEAARSVRQGASGATSYSSVPRKPFRTFHHHKARGAGLPPILSMLRLCSLAEETPRAHPGPRPRAGPLPTLSIGATMQLCRTDCPASAQPLLAVSHVIPCHVLPSWTGPRRSTIISNTPPLPECVDAPWKSPSNDRPLPDGPSWRPGSSGRLGRT